jgi:hypothetical protein
MPNLKTEVLPDVKGFRTFRNVRQGRTDAILHLLAKVKTQGFLLSTYAGITPYIPRGMFHSIPQVQVFTHDAMMVYVDTVKA